MVADALAGTTLLHLLAEIAATALALAGVALLWRRMEAVRRKAAALGSDLEAARAEAERWRSETRDVLQGLAAAIDRQFERWNLTPAEREIGLLLLKGLSHKEVATVRETTERTVRQQALVLYRKAGLCRANRARGVLPRRPAAPGASLMRTRQDARGAQASGSTAAQRRHPHWKSSRRAASQTAMTAGCLSLRSTVMA